MQPVHPQTTVVHGQPDPLCCGCAGKVKVYVAAGYSLFASTVYVILLICALTSDQVGSYFQNWQSGVGLVVHIGWLVSSIVLIVGVANDWQRYTHGLVWQVCWFCAFALLGIVFITVVVLIATDDNYSEIADSSVAADVWGIVIAIFVIPLTLHVTFGILGYIGWRHLKRCTAPITMMHVMQNQPMTVMQDGQSYPQQGYESQGYAQKGYEQAGYPQHGGREIKDGDKPWYSIKKTKENKWNSLMKHLRQ